MGQLALLTTKKITTVVIYDDPRRNFGCKNAFLMVLRVFLAVFINFFGLNFQKEAKMSDSSDLSEADDVSLLEEQVKAKKQLLQMLLNSKKRLHPSPTRYKRRKTGDDLVRKRLDNYDQDPNSFLISLSRTYLQIYFRTVFA